MSKLGFSKEESAKRKCQFRTLVKSTTELAEGIIGFDDIDPDIAVNAHLETAACLAEQTRTKKGRFWASKIRRLMDVEEA